MAYRDRLEALSAMLERLEADVSASEVERQELKKLLEEALGLLHQVADAQRDSAAEAGDDAE